MDQLRDPMILLLIAAGVLTTILRGLSDTVIIAAVVVFSTITGLVQEARAERAVAALEQLAPARTRAWRDGRLVEISAEDVVPGDLLSLEAGDVVAADATVEEAHQPQLDESMMTGESVPVDHRAGDDRNRRRTDGGSQQRRKPGRSALRPLVPVWQSWVDT